MTTFRQGKLGRTFDLVAAISLTGFSAEFAAYGHWIISMFTLLFAWSASRRVFPTT